MTDIQGDSPVSGHASSALDQLADLPSPPRPTGAAGVLLNRMLVYARPDQVPALLPHINPDVSGLVLAGVRTSKRMKLLADQSYDGLILADPAAHERHLATVDAPFYSPENQVLPAAWEESLDQQLTAGASVALTPTKYIGPGDTDALKAAVRQVQRLGRSDLIFVAPLDISLLDKRHIRQTTAILADCGSPIGLILGKQFDPLEQAPSRIIQNLRILATTVDLMPIRTDFNAFDLVAHGAFAGAIGTGGTTRHAVIPTEKPMSGNGRDQSPSVLIPEFMSWWKGSKIAKLFGAKENLAPRCPCGVCASRKLTRFQRRDQQHEAIAHAVEVWSGYAQDMLAAPTLRQRAEYWRNVCRNARNNHEMFAAQLKMIKPIPVQRPLEMWAKLPVWPSDAA